MRDFSWLKFIFLVSPLILFLTESNAQRYARIDGNWTSAIWASTPSGVAGSAATPTATDDAYTNGFLVTSSTTNSCRNLYIDANKATASLSLTSFSTITVTGTLTGWDGIGLSEAVPVANPAVTFSSTSKIRLTGANITTNYLPAYVIYAFDNTSPLGRVTFDFGSGVTRSIITNLGVTNALIVNSGTLTPDPGAFIQVGTSGLLTVVSGAAITTGDPIHGGSTTTSVGTLTINGTLTTSSYVNSSSFTLGPSAVLNSSYSGVTNQTQGWWFQSTSPTTTSLDPTSSVNLNSTSNQNISPSPIYGNLTLGGGGTKSVSGSTSISIAGNLTFSSTGVTYSSAQQTVFNGTSSQSINGGGTANFNGGLQLNKSTGTLTLSQNISIQNGLTLTAGTIDFGSNTVSLSGNLVNNATLTPSGSTLSITGTTAMSGSSATSLNNLTITGTGILTPPSTLSLGGNFTNNGTFNSNSGTITFNGTAAQSITGTTSLSNITVSNSAGVTNNGAMSLNGILSLSGSGAFNANPGTLTLASSGQSSTGMIGALGTPSNFTGNVTVQRFINGPGDWRYLAMPITNGNVGIWQTAFPVTGNFTNPSPNGSNGVVDQTAASVYYFNAATQAYVAVGSGVSTGSTPLSNTVGYSAYTYLTGNCTVSATGTITKGTVNIPLSTASPGWNLIPNPYPSAVGWNLMTRTGLSNTMNLRIANNTFATYLAGSGTCTGCSFNTNWRGEIPIGQSFWVNSASATNLQMTEAVKTTTQPTFVREAAAQNFVRVTLHSPTEVDDAVVMFRPGATVNFDTLYDGLKRKNGNYVSSLGMNSYINISSYTTNSKMDMAINGMPPVACTESVKLKVTDAPVGSYTLVFTDLKSINLGYSVTLVDHFLSKQITVTDSLQYGFTITADTSSFGTSRFEMQFLAPQVNAVSPPLSVSNRCDPATLPVNFTSQAGINYQFMISGNPVSAITNGTGQAITATIDKTKLVAGSNAIDLVATTAGGCSTKTFSSAFQYQLNALANMPKVVNDTICQSSKANLTANGAPANGSYLWYDSLNKTTSIPGATGATFQTDTLSAAKTYYVLAVNADGCQSTRASITVAVISIAKPIVTVNGQLLNSNSTSGNQWLLSGTPIAGATTQQYQATKSGTYSVKVTNSSSCSKTSNDVVMVVTGLETGVNDEIINAFPNPVKDRLQLSAPKGFENLKLFDSQGRILETMNALSPGDPLSLQIDFSAYSKGLYLINVTVGGKNYFVKIIKD